MMAGLGIIAAAPAPLGDDSFAAGGARLECIIMRLRKKPGRIELGRTRLRRGGGRFGRFIICSARFRGITRRRIIIRRLRRSA